MHTVGLGHIQQVNSFFVFRDGFWQGGGKLTFGYNLWILALRSSLDEPNLFLLAATMMKVAGQLIEAVEKGRGHPGNW